MGNIHCNSINSIDTVNTLEKELYIYTDENGIINYISEPLLELLNYEKDIILNSFIGILMSPLMNYLHKEVYFNKYKKLSSIQKNLIHVTLSGLSKKRPLIIYDIEKNPIYVNLYISFVNIMNSNSLNYKFKAKFEKIDDNRDLNLQTKIIVPNDTFIETKNKSIIISIDFKDSTEFLSINGVRDFININKRFYNDIVFLIKHFYYPYIYIHEIVGDCFVIVINADWTYNLQNYCASLAFSFIVHLFDITKEYVKIRIGIVYDKILYGNIGDNFRLFGTAMHKVNRLEKVCKINTLVCDGEFFDKLNNENIFTRNELIVSAKKGTLRGLGESIYYLLEIDKINYKNIFI
jgi:hypothetical protein